MTRNAATCTPRARTCDAAPALDAEAMRIAGHVRHLAAVVACMRDTGRALPDSRVGSSPGAGPRQRGRAADPGPAATTDARAGTHTPR